MLIDEIFYWVFATASSHWPYNTWATQSGWKWMGIRLAMASISNIGDIWNAPMIYMTALLCIFLSFLSGYANGTLL